ncbi:MAG: polyprenyl synthetase family protein [Alphaproteobacteria bacterium]|jgi:farnesyl diphosphate synthase|nr:polyprenyl synthetase family protein [Alphaproteobacteria bacterium]MBT5390498.1 polyprenyl synthetase family protein [Alphaproteobacteria bacterium]MBT5540602.1 polyprenyl synthetase family protein [Alphaproteobacteria bacterium]MBT5654838.1 polyprenyl synthetase family protein [Alphaproteobacteria bacterium]
METLKDNLKKINAEVHTVLRELLPPAEGIEASLIDAMEYATLDGGKRLRPFLVLKTSEMFNVSKDSALRTAAAVEMIHCFSLIHDDLPAMDNADIRRGKPSCHVQFGESTAILAGDSLQSLAFEVLADEKTHSDPRVRVELVRALAKASGYQGMSGGQMIDLATENQKLDMGSIIRLLRLKTGELFAFSCESGAILANTSAESRHALHAYAHDFGLAFQIVDDLLDETGTEQELGKPTGSSSVLGKATLVNLLGIDKAKEQARILVNQAITHLDYFDSEADPLREIAQFILDRRS